MSEHKLRILQVITARHMYGAEHMLVYLCAGLRARGHEVAVACKPLPPLEEALTAYNIPVFPMRISGKGNILAPWRLARLARQWQADVIHTHLSTASLWGSVAGRLTGIPVVTTVHALNFPCWYMGAQRILTCSEGVRQHLLHWGLSPKRLQVLYNGLPSELFVSLKSGPQMRRALGLSEEAIVVGVVGQLCQRKGQRYMIEAMAQLLPRFPHLQCLFIGDGPCRQTLANLAQKLQIRHAIHFLGFCAEAVQLMAALDIVALPAVAKEGLGLVLVEAAFLGKPLVGSDLPGINEVIVPGHTGLLVPPKNSQALAEAIAALVSDWPWARRLGLAARKRAQQLFTLDKMAQRAEEIYYQILAGYG